MDEGSKFRKNFNEDFRKITKAEAAQLTGRALRHYERITAAQNIAAVPKDKPKNEIMNNRIRLREFDSETYKPVSAALMSGKGSLRAEAKRRLKAGKTPEQGETENKFYDTKLNMSLPKPRPKPAPKEGNNLKKLATKRMRG